MSFFRASLGLVIVVMISQAGFVRGWHENGHYIIAYMAKKELEKSRPEAIDWVLRLLEPLQQECGEGNYPFIEATSWADKARAADWRVLTGHHFIPIPWFDEKATPVQFFTPQFANVTYGIQESSFHLRSSKEDPYGSSKSVFGKSISLRLLMHFIGDVHQPLHASDRITPTRPEGDAGGNLFIIKRFNDKTMDNLHYLWDTMFEDPRSNPKGMLTSGGYELVQRRALEIMAEYPRSSLGKYFKTPSKSDSWALESHVIARKFVYAGLTENGTIPEKYVEEGRIICRERIALAGYRLADRLKDIYDSLQSKKQ